MQRVMNMKHTERMFEEDVDDQLDEMWEDPIYSDIQSYQRNSFSAEQKDNCSLRQINLPLNVREPLLNQNHLHQHSLMLNVPYSLHHDDQKQWHSHQYPGPTNSLVHSCKGQSQMLLDTGFTTPGREEDEDYAKCLTL